MEAQIGNHTYQFHELNYGGNSRGVRVHIQHLGNVNNTMNYRLGHAYDPHNLDINWYQNHVGRFYLELGSAVANHLEANNDNWANINWPNAIHAEIHGHGYHAIREDLF